VGGLAFLPVLGFLFGFVAAVWGLISDRPRALVGAGLGAAGFLLNFAGCAGLAYWATRSDGGSLGTELARTELVQLVQQLEQHHGEHREYPASLRELRVGPFDVPAPDIYDRSAGVLNRTFLYQYRVAADRQSYSLSSVGADGRPGTADDIFPLLPDSLAGRTGLRTPDTTAVEE